MYAVFLDVRVGDDDRSDVGVFVFVLGIDVGGGRMT